MLRLILKITFLRQQYSLSGQRHICFNCKTEFSVSDLGRYLNLCPLPISRREERSTELIHGTKCKHENYVRDNFPVWPKSNPYLIEGRVLEISRAPRGSLDFFYYNSV